NSVFSFVRYAANNPPVLVVSNMTPVPRYGYRIGVPFDGAWREIFNSDSEFYGGADIWKKGQGKGKKVAAHGQPHSGEVIFSPLATIYFWHHLFFLFPKSF